MIRLAEIYLTAAEAILQGGGGSPAEAATYVNYIRERAYGDKDHNFSSVNMQTLRDERCRELYSESTRRTDLIRFGKFTKGYNWDWKNGERLGSDVDDFYALFPIPESEMTNNPALEQNEGYK